MVDEGRVELDGERVVVGFSLIAEGGWMGPAIVDRKESFPGVGDGRSVEDSLLLAVVLERAILLVSEERQGELDAPVPGEVIPIPRVERRLVGAQLRAPERPVDRDPIRGPRPHGRAAA